MTGVRFATAATVVLLAATGCHAGEPGARAATLVLTPTESPSPSPSPSPTPPPPTSTLPDGTRTLFPGHRLVAFYGAAGAPGLGVLGTGSPEEVWPKLRRQAKPYRRAPATVLPAYELITYLATSSRGNQGNYSSRIKNKTIRHYSRAAKRHGAMLILDIQPGRGRFIHDAKTLERWLRKPYVGLALDPEWKLYGDQKPLEQIGHTTARQINHVSHWLNRLSRRELLPQKPLLVHQFTEDMVRHKEDVRSRSRLALVFNVDGFGSKSAKVSKYEEFARDDRFPLGFKLFYDYDTPMMSPREVLRLRPPPKVVEYQ
ncbi:MAG: hypothetical protein QOJ03_1724 [Frankiaceae bacterium]|jgi:hypothetical protein|nr:hypothetical protein [Frankiaceae bacterium]